MGAQYGDLKTNAPSDELLLIRVNGEIRARHVDEPNSFFKIAPVYENNALVMWQMIFSDNDITYFMEESAALVRLSELEDEMSVDSWDLFTNDAVTVSSLKVLSF